MSDKRGWFLGLVRGGIEDALKSAVKWTLAAVAALFLGIFGFSLVKKEDRPQSSTTAPGPTNVPGMPTTADPTKGQLQQSTDKEGAQRVGEVGAAAMSGPQATPIPADPTPQTPPRPEVAQAPKPKLATIDLMVSPNAPFTATMTTPVHDPYNSRAFDTTVTLTSGPKGAKLKLLLNSRGEADGWTASVIGADSGCFGAPGRVDHDLPMSQPDRWRSDGKGFLSIPPKFPFPASISFFCYSGIKAGDDVTLKMRVYALNERGSIDPFDIFLPAPTRIIGDD